ncbi:MAG: polysaccharide deacetylase family protein [Candidatus Omnitrophica bacterium]|nr:polysaccharide deacetylase family protein [Candidatus Omnitrophota bacterium]
MKKINIKKLLFFSLLLFFFIALAIGSFTVFFDQAVIVRRDTIYRVPSKEKVVALTFDDGPSLIWTPQILAVLKAEDVKATFFMIGEHVQQFPELAMSVAEAGHEVGNHTYDHHGIFYYKPDELNKEVEEAEKIIKIATGVKTKYFRPPKAWLTKQEKQQLKDMGYETVLWSLNSKDWVTFDDRYIVNYILHHIRPGDILLFHDSGGVFKPEGGNRKETVKAVSRLIEKLKQRGYRFVTISQLLGLQVKDEKQ